MNVLLDDLRGRLAAAGDPARARLQAAYMKSAMPYHGVMSAGLRAICREVLASYPFGSPEAWRADVAAVWDGAAFREERYAALALAADARARPLQGLPRTARAAPPRDAEALAAVALELYRRLIVDGAWWDLVDELATHRVRGLLAVHPALVAPRMRAWAAGEELWLRRAAILAQVGLKDRTDAPLLAEVIEPALEAPVFWLRKAIGWALRDYAKTDPAWVRAFVARAGPRLSGLSRREALKHLDASIDGDDGDRRREGSSGLDPSPPTEVKSLATALRAALSRPETTVDPRTRAHTRPRSTSDP